MHTLNLTISFHGIVRLVPKRGMMLYFCMLLALIGQSLFENSYAAISSRRITWLFVLVCGGCRCGHVAPVAKPLCSALLQLRRLWSRVLNCKKTTLWGWVTDQVRSCRIHNFHFTDGWVGSILGLPWSVQVGTIKCNPQKRWWGVADLNNSSSIQAFAGTLHLRRVSQCENCFFLLWLWFSRKWDIFTSFLSIYFKILPRPLLEAPM